MSWGEVGLLYLASLPVGYERLARYYPDRMSWWEFGVFLSLTLVWPCTLLSIWIVERGDP